MNPPKAAHLFEEIAQIRRMERGKLTVMREGPEGPYYKHQAWEKGKNVSRYVCHDQAAAVQEAIEGYHKFQALTAQYAQAVIEKTRAELAVDSKKKNDRLRRIDNEAVKTSLILMGETADRIWGKRLKAVMSPLISAMEKRGPLEWDTEVREKRLSMSPATIDR